MTNQEARSDTSWLAEQGRPPTVELLARPIIGVIDALADVRERVMAIEGSLVEHGGSDLTAARELLGVVRRVAEVVGTAAHSAAADDSALVAAGMRTVIEGLTGVSVLASMVDAPMLDELRSISQ